MFKPMIHMCIARSILVTSTACLPSPPAKPTRSITPLLSSKEHHGLPFAASPRKEAHSHHSSLISTSFTASQLRPRLQW